MNIRRDQLEASMEAFFERHSITYTRPERTKDTQSTLDYYLPRYNLSIEVKAYATERLVTQIVKSGLDAGPVMVLIGLDGVLAFIKMIEEAQSARMLSP